MPFLAQKQESKIHLFGLNFDNLSMLEVIESIDKFIKNRRPSRMMITPNVALTIWARNNNYLRKAYHQCALLLVDGNAIYYASHLLGKPLKENVSAYRIFCRLLEQGPQKNYRFYFFGATQESVEKAVINIQKRYPGIQIVGYRNGYFKPEEIQDIVKNISGAKPDILFVAMTSPLKEKFLSENLERLGVPVSLGVGGSFDIAAGLCKEAPSWISKLCLEWLYRLIQEPKRLWKRYLITNTVFMRLLFVELFKTHILRKNGGK